MDKDISKQIIQAFSGGEFCFEESDPQYQREIQGLRRVFGEPPYPYSGYRETNAQLEDPYEIIKDLQVLNSDQVKYALARVMVKILRDYPSSEALFYVDAVVLFLYAGPSLFLSSMKTLAGQENVNAFQEQLTQNLRAVELPFIEEKEAIFASFSSTQCIAVTAWLDRIKDWYIQYLRQNCGTRKFRVFAHFNQCSNCQ